MYFGKKNLDANGIETTITYTNQKLYKRPLIRKIFIKRHTFD